MSATIICWWQRPVGNVFRKMEIKQSSKHRRHSMKPNWHRVALWTVIMLVVVALNVYLGLRNTGQLDKVLDSKTASHSH